VEELVAAADAALYEAKRSGKNRVVTATAKRKSRSPAAAADGSYAKASLSLRP
jgi:predicted signal transduction protein with EAL and GGDEF domain